MEIILTDHTKLRMVQRVITLAMVMECVQLPEYVYPQRNGTTLLRKRIKGIPGADFIVVISKKEGNKITVITSYIT